MLSLFECNVKYNYILLASQLKKITLSRRYLLEGIYVKQTPCQQNAWIGLRFNAIGQWVVVRIL